MQRFFITLLAFAVLNTPVFSQNRKLSLEDVILKGRTSLAPERLAQAQWIPGTDQLAYIVTEGGNELLKIYDVKGKEPFQVLISAKDFAGAANIQTERFPGIKFTSADNFRYYYKNAYYSFNLKSRKATLLHNFPEGASSQDMSDASGYVAYTVGDNLHVSVGERKTLAITQDSTPGIVNGQAVHRNEFGINKGTFWSNSGQLLAYYRMDESMVTQYPIYNLGSRPAEGNEIRYPVAGAKSHHAKVCVFNMKTGSTMILQTGEPLEQYLTNVSWSPDDKYIYIAVVDRKQDHMWLNQYDVSNGAFIKTIFSEKNPKYVEPEDAMIFVKNDPGKFLWFSERDGYNHLYLYDKDGKMVRQLTKGSWIVTEFLGFDEKGKNVFVSTTTSGPLNRDIYRIEISSGRQTLISSGSGVHVASFSSNGKYFLDQFSSQTTPRNTLVAESSGKIVRTLLSSNNPLAEYSIGKHEMNIIKREGLPDLYSRIIYPPDFNPEKKYPVLVYLYGGPHLQLITNTWLLGADLWLEYMAQQGYIVFSLDNRGSANRGFEFESAIHRRVGTVEMEDQLAGVNWLKSKKFVDSTRLGVYGWSFGGFLTTSLMTRNPGVFKVAVAGGPVIDWGLYEVMYTERYMDTPEENPDGYKDNNLLNHVKNLQGRLLMIHGTSDDVVLWQHSLLYLKQCVKDGKLVDYFVYPGHPHNVLGADRIHLMKKITAHFNEHL